eukprot:sb/3471677/
MYPLNPRISITTMIDVYQFVVTSLSGQCHLREMRRGSGQCSVVTSTRFQDSSLAGQYALTVSVRAYWPQYALTVSELGGGCQANALTTVLARSLFERSENWVRPIALTVGGGAKHILIQSDPDLVTSSGERVLVTKSGKQPIRTLHLGHVTGYQPIRDQYSLTGLERLDHARAKVARHP